MKEFVLSTLSSSRPCNYLSFSCASARHTHSDSIQTAIRIPDASLSGACRVCKDLFISIQNARCHVRGSGTCTVFDGERNT